MSDDLDQIRRKSVPLSHTQSDTAKCDSSSTSPNLVWWFGGAVGVALLLAVFLVVPGLVAPDPSAPVTVINPEAATTSATTTPAVVPKDDGPAPFAALQRQQARERASEMLARFVELQLQLEESMQVGAWGQEQLDSAKALATEGDQEFLDERFEDSLAAYDAAASTLEALIETGAQLLEGALADGQNALDNADAAAAQQAFDLAITIDPDNSEAERGLERTALLPEVIVLMRQGKNHELAESWAEAVQVYEQVAALDPDTAGLEAGLASARAGLGAARIRDNLSAAFSALDAGRYGDARRAFEKVLALDPGNSVARGGLEQVAKRTDINRIGSLRETAQEAERAERWQDAMDAYNQVLALDANIQFAKDGKLRSTNQFRTHAALGKIIANPDKLSSPKLFDQAKEIVVRAERLQPRGATLSDQISQVNELIRVYATPVPVTLLSDNATKVTLSTVGVLGSFASKELNLRPGAYTLIGSRDGYRDVRTSLLVRPDMQPLEIRCTETF
jgi:tetratricopeptide (TPR) repeat protein